MKDKYFLERNKENSQLYELLESDIAHFSGNSLDYQAPRKSNEVVRKARMGFVSEILKNHGVFLYDNDILQDKYPHGFITESEIFIPAKLYEQVKNEKVVHYRDYTFNLTGALFSIYAMQMINSQFDNVFDKGEQNTIIQNELNKEYEKNGDKVFKAVDDLIKNKLPEFVSATELKQFIKDNNFSQYSQDVLEGTDKNSRTLYETLFNVKEVHNPEHLLHRLADKVIEKKNILELESLSSEEFANYYQNGGTTEKRKMAQDILSTISENVINNNTDVNKALTILHEKYVPHLIKLNEPDFAVAIRNLQIKLEQQYEYSYGSDERTRLAILINSNEDISLNQDMGSFMETVKDKKQITDAQREHLISVVTSFEEIKRPINPSPRLK